MRETVAIVGGGVAGLSAAHELMERGFAVEVYERRAFFGGKAASFRIQAGNGARLENDSDGLPGEHGFRFFPGWYRHLTDTMARIPDDQSSVRQRSVADRLVSVQSNLMAWFDRAPVALPLQVPTSTTQAAAVTQFVKEFRELGLTAAEAGLFVRKILEILVMPDAQQLENQSWWDFLECSKAERSRAFLDLVRATTRTSVAAKAEKVSAYTIGRLAVRTLIDTMSSIDRVLDGPTSEVWIDPWIAHLKKRGVRFHSDVELESIGFDAERRKVEYLIMEPSLSPQLRRVRKRLLQLGKGLPQPPVSTGEKPLEDQVKDGLEELKESLGSPPEDPAARVAAANLRALVGGAVDQLAGGSLTPEINAALTTQILVLEAALRAANHRVSTDYFVLALPLEQLAYYVNRSSMLTFLAPELKNVIRLSRELDWMAGIQFYLKSNLDISAGHLIGIDSDWALTAVESTQYWKNTALPRDVRAVLSVDISAWDRKGRTIRKEAFNCTPDEIAIEVWNQLEEMLNRRNGNQLLRRDMLIGGALVQNSSYHLDQSIIDVRDRKKQAFYERARGLNLGTLGQPTDSDSEAKVVEEYMWGPRQLFNAEPLLINRAGTRKYRPDAATSIPNLFLAGDYLKTETDLACMEGANEAARLAVNGILKAANSREPPCELWPFSPSRQALESVLALGASLGLALGSSFGAVRSVASAVTKLQDRLWKGFGGGE